MWFARQTETDSGDSQHVGSYWGTEHGGGALGLGPDISPFYHHAIKSTKF
jgi:hypothetical protein